MEKGGKAVPGDAAIKGNLFMDAWNEINCQPPKFRVCRHLDGLIMGYSEAEPSASSVHRGSIKAKDKGSHFNRSLRR